jgi:hypothetical protein
MHIFLPEISRVSVADLTIFENVCSVQKDVMAGTNNAAYQFLMCCYFEKGMIGDCYE